MIESGLDVGSNDANPPAEPTEPSSSAASSRNDGGFKFLTDYLKLITSRYLGILIGAVRGLVIPGLLDPSAYGVYKTFQLLPNYVRAGHLGAVSGLARQIPYYRGRRDDTALRDVTQVGYTFSIGSALLACLVLAVWSLTMDDRTTRIALLVFLVYIVTDQQVAFRETLLTGYERFADTAKLRILVNVIGAVFAIFGAWAYGLMGLVIATSATGLVSLTLYRWVSGFGFPGVRLDRAIARELLTIGAPILMTGLLYNVFFTVDRFIIVKFLGAEAMGFYSLAVTFVGYINDLTSLLSRVILPRMVVRLGETDSPEKIRRFIYLPLAGVAVAFPLLILAVHYAGPWAFRLAFPKYLAGADALEILSFSILTYAHFAVYMNFVFAVKKQLKMIWIFPVATAVTAALSFAAIGLGWGLEGVAGATLLGFVTLAMTMCIWAEKVLFEARDWPRRLLRLYGPTAVLAALIACDHAGFGARSDSVLGTLARAGAVGTLYLPVVALAWKANPELGQLLKMLKGARGRL